MSRLQSSSPELLSLVLFFSAPPVTDYLLPSCPSIPIPKAPVFGDPSDNVAQSILSACKERFHFYAQSLLIHRIETKNLPAILSFIKPVVSIDVLDIFKSGINNDYRGGSQFFPPKMFSQCVTAESFICHSVLQNFENGFLLGPFSASTRFISWQDQGTKELHIECLRFVNIFTVPKTKKEKLHGRAVYDLKITGYNLNVPDVDAYVELPKFLFVISTLRDKKYAAVLDLSNVFRQWQVTMNSYADFAYYFGGYVWIDTSLVFGIKSGVRDCQIIT